MTQKQDECIAAEESTTATKEVQHTATETTAMAATAPTTAAAEATAAVTTFILWMEREKRQKKQIWSVLGQCTISAPLVQR